MKKPEDTVSPPPPDPASPDPASPDPPSSGRKSHSRVEKAFAPLAFLAGNPTNPSAVPFLTTPPEGLALAFTAPTSSEAEWLRQVLLDAGFHVEYVATTMTGVFGTSGSVHVYVRADQREEASEFLRRLQETAEDEFDSDVAPETDEESSAQ